MAPWPPLWIRHCRSGHRKSPPTITAVMVIYVLYSPFCSIFSDDRFLPILKSLFRFVEMKISVCRTYVGFDMSKNSVSDGRIEILLIEVLEILLLQTMMSIYRHQ